MDDYPTRCNAFEPSPQRMSAQSQTIQEQQSKMDCETAQMNCLMAQFSAQTAADSSAETLAAVMYRRAECEGLHATGPQLAAGDAAIAVGDAADDDGYDHVYDAQTPHGNANGDWNVAEIFWQGGIQFAYAAGKYAAATPNYDAATVLYDSGYDDYYAAAMGGYMDAYTAFDDLYMILSM